MSAFYRFGRAASRGMISGVWRPGRYASAAPTTSSVSTSVNGSVNCRWGAWTIFPARSNARRQRTISGCGSESLGPALEPLWNGSRSSGSFRSRTDACASPRRKTTAGGSLTTSKVGKRHDYRCGSTVRETCKTFWTESLGTSRTCPKHPCKGTKHSCPRSSATPSLPDSAKATRYGMSCCAWA